MASSSLANNFVIGLPRFMTKHSGVSNPSLSLSCRVFSEIKVTLVVYFNVN